MRYNGAGCTMAVTGPAPCSVGASVEITCGWLGEPGQNGQCWSAPRRPSSSPTMTHERVIGSLRSSMTPKSITGTLRPGDRGGDQILIFTIGNFGNCGSLLAPVWFYNYPITKLLN